MKQRELIRLAESQIRQQLVGGIVLLAIGLMLVNTFIGLPGWVKAELVTNTNMTFNVTAGDFSIMNSPSSMAFASHDYGVSNEYLVANEQIDGLTVIEYRGAPTDAWDVVANANNFDATLPATDMKCFSANGDITNIVNADTNLTAAGAGGVLGGGGTVVLNGSADASGVFQYDNAEVTLNVDGDEPAGTYTAILTYTLS